MNYHLIRDGQAGWLIDLARSGGDPVECAAGD